MIKQISAKEVVRKIEQKAIAHFDLVRTRELRGKKDVLEQKVLSLYDSFKSPKNQRRKERIKLKIANLIMANYALLAAPNFNDKLLAICVALKIV